MATKQDCAQALAEGLRINLRERRPGVMTVDADDPILQRALNRKNTTLDECRSHGLLHEALGDFTCDEAAVINAVGTGRGVTSR